MMFCKINVDKLDTKSKRDTKKKHPREIFIMGVALTLSVPGGHGDDPVDSDLSHGADHRLHGLGVSRHP